MKHKLIKERCGVYCLTNGRSERYKIDKIQVDIPHIAQLERL